MPINVKPLRAENHFTAEGAVLPAAADRGGRHRSRAVRRVIGLLLVMCRLSLTGTVDVVEFSEIGGR